MGGLGLWLVAFCLAALHDWLSVHWMAARDAQRPGLGAILAGLIELLAWSPVVFVIETGDPGVVVASVAGSIAANYWALKPRA